MSKITVKKIILCCVTLAAIALFTIYFLKNRIMYTSNTISPTYSRSASAYDNNQLFYVKDNILYFVGDTDDHVVRCVKNNWTHTFAKLPVNYDNFVIVDDKTTVVRTMTDDIYLLVDGDLTELWQGESLGYDGEKYLYFVTDGSLYSATLTEREPQKIISFDRLLGAYHDAIVYENEGCIYQLLYAEPNTPQLLAEDNPWSNDSPWLDYLYTSNYALCFGIETLDMYTYETGEIKRLFDANIVDENFTGMAVMAVAASDNELYVSRQNTSMAYWPINNKKINGTYKYDFVTGEWTKVDDNTYFELARFDERSMYGCIIGGIDDLFDPLKRIELE